MDDLMLAGCTGFVSSSLVTYCLAIWPFLLFVDSLSWSNVLKAMAMGLLPAAIFGGYATRRFGLPGATGFLGGALAIAVFLHLNIKRILLAVAVQPGLLLDFPPAMVYLIPLAWVLASVAIAGLLLPKGELPTKEESNAPPP